MRVCRAFVIVCGVVLLAGAGCKPTGSGSEWERVEPPRAAADFTLPQLNGDAVSLSSLRGHPVIMEFWATWCAPCRFSTPSLEAVYRRYKDRGVMVLLINQGESAEQARAWAGRRFTAPMLLDRDGEVASSYRVVGIPRLFILDREGNIVYDHSGYAGGLERNLHAILDQLLAPATHG
jgi:peroxiredoxin